MLKRTRRRRLLVLLLSFIGAIGATAVWSRFFAGPVVRAGVWGVWASKLKYSDANYRATRERAAAIIAALESWKAKNGGYPMTLEELTPTEIPRIEPPLVGNGVWEYGRPNAGQFELGFFVGPLYESDTYDSAKSTWYTDR